MQKHAAHSLLLLLAAAAAPAQTVSFGVKGGIPLIAPNTWNDESRPYIIGPSVEVRLPAGFAIEADALYRRIGNSFAYSFITGTATGSYTSRVRGNSWEFPLLAKYYFHFKQSGWQPFVGTGYAFRTIHYHDDSYYSIPSGTNLVGIAPSGPVSSNYGSSLEVGAVISAGVRYRIGRFALLPEVRYTRWGGTENGMRRNEANVMLGINF